MIEKNQLTLDLNFLTTSFKLFFEHVGGEFVKPMDQGTATSLLDRMRFDT